jgi:hypothetical protein
MQHGQESGIAHQWPAQSSLEVALPELFLGHDVGHLQHSEQQANARNNLQR